MSGSNGGDGPSGKAVASLVFAILGLTCCPCVGSIVAVMLGLDEKSGVGRAGFHLGWIGPALILVGLFFNMACLCCLAPCS